MIFQKDLSINVKQMEFVTSLSTSHIRQKHVPNVEIIKKI